MPRPNRTAEPLAEFKVVPKFEGADVRRDSSRYVFDSPERLEQIPWDVSPEEFERRRKLKEERENYAFPEPIEVLIRRFDRYMDATPARRAAIGHLRLGNALRLAWLDLFLVIAFYTVITNKFPSLDFIPFVLAALSMSAGISTITAIGNIERDRKYDDETKRKRPLVTGAVAVRSAWYQACILFFIGIALSFAFLGPLVVGLFILLMALSTQYAFPPLKMNSRPVFSQLFLVVNALVFYLCVVAHIGLEYASYGAYFAGAVILYHTLGESLARETLEVKDAINADDNSTAIYFGASKTVLGAFACMAFGNGLWALSVFAMYSTNIIFAFATLVYSIAWCAYALNVVGKIYEKWTRGNAKRFLYYMRISFLVLCILTILSFVLYVPEPTYVPIFNFE